MPLFVLPILLHHLQWVMSVGVGHSIHPSASSPCFPAMFAFGDSLTDVGNNAYAAASAHPPSTRPPYGETFFHMATGRYSDGRLITDFLAQATHVPLLQPYLRTRSTLIQQPRQHLTHDGLSGDDGIAFAVAGATAMDAAWLSEMGIRPYTWDSLDVQIEWFRDYKAQRCMQLNHTREQQCQELYVSQALFFFGEIGGNDLNYALALGRSLSEVSSYIPAIAHKIQSSLEALIREGASFIAVEGVLPMGCLPVYVGAASASEVDDMGCVAPINALSILHNDRLQQILHDLQIAHPHVSIIYFDFFQAFADVLIHAPADGITNTLDECYGGSPFNHTHSPHPKLCSNPEAYANWDGVHPTEAMNRAVSTRFLVIPGFQKPFPNFLTQRCELTTYIP